ncbi:hypothetical protein AVEN_37539-1 [Araneus ventricosus]|uniref:Uncharacterized protein n=1 Tax=Araneus ventricosus TaxID=182803 RepID=A0A4Y2L669_ARAVE|nr:hypothetical protein AVEN_37539-1 [Araneus ventricosus]
MHFCHLSFKDVNVRLQAFSRSYMPSSPSCGSSTEFEDCCPLNKFITGKNRMGLDQENKLVLERLECHVLTGNLAQIGTCGSAPYCDGAPTT